MHDGRLILWAVQNVTNIFYPNIMHSLELFTEVILAWFGFSRRICEKLLRE